MALVGSPSARERGEDPHGAGPASTRAGRELAALRRDIEEWRRLAGADRSLLETLLHTIPHGIFVSDSGGRFVLQNRGAERIWAGSATLDSVAAWGVYRAFHPDGRPYAPDDWSMARCLTRREIVEAEEVHYQRFDDSHGILLGSCAPIFNDAGELDGALGVFADITALKHAEERLQLVTDSLPVLIAYVDPDLRYRFANKCHEAWLGAPRASIEGRPVREVLGEEAFAALAPALAQALGGEPAGAQLRLGRGDDERLADAACLPHRAPDRSVAGVIAVITDVTERTRIERERARWAERNEQLLRLTAGLTGAVTPAQVLQAVVEGTAEVLHAAWSGLWLVGEERRAITPARSFGLEGAERAAVAGRAERWVGPVLERGEPVWTEPEGGKALAVLPLTVEGRRRGALAFAFDADRAPGEAERSLLVVAARHSAQALERVRLLREAELAYQEAELLYRLTDAVNRAASVEEVYEASLDTIKRALGVERASIHFLGADGEARMVAWRGLGEAYRGAAESVAPLRSGEAAPEPLWLEDAAASDAPAGVKGELARERIGAMALVPLVYESRLLGELRLYWDAPVTVTARERSVAQSVADQVASAAGRKLAQREKERLIGELTQTVRLNELFTGVVGHDLRNPLSAIMTTAQNALRKNQEERVGKRLGRVIEAGERMTRMIEQLLDFTRARAGGGITIDPQEAHLGEITRRVVQLLQDGSPDRAVLLDAEGDLRGSWDPERIAQVLTSLTDNALRHGAAGAAAVVHLDGTEADRVVARVSNQGALRGDLLPVLFEAFRSAKMRGERSRGLGMGLYIAHQIALSHGGDLAVEADEAEQRTTFTVTLPRRAPPRQRPLGIGNGQTDVGAPPSTAST